MTRTLGALALALTLSGCVKVEPVSRNDGPNPVYLVARTPEGCAIYMVSNARQIIVCQAPYQGGVGG